MQTGTEVPERRQSAQFYATRDIPFAEPDETAGSIWSRMRGRRFESAREIAVCVNGSLVGLVRIEDLIAASDDTAIHTIMDAEPPIAATSEDREIAAQRAVDHGVSSVAVLDGDATLAGLIPPVRLLSVLLEEHHEDLARLGGYLRSATAARRAGLESVPRRFAHRMPWLLLGLAGAFVAALTVGAFEARLEANVVLAFFIPGIVYLADAVGTQTETVVIRGLSVGVGIRDVVWRELLTGVLVGAVIAGVYMPAALFVWSDLDVAVAVSLALFAACSIATLVALVLPAVLSRLGTDPAFGSGPVATVVQDLLSIAIYLGVVILVVG